MKKFWKMSGVLTLFACLFVEAETARLIPIEVALIAPLTGNVSEIGSDLRDASSLALIKARKEFQKLGFDLQLKTYDDRLSVQVGEKQAKKIVSNPRTLIAIGSFRSEVTLAIAKTFKSSHLGLIAPTGSENVLTDGGFPNIDRIVARNDGMGTSTGKFMEGVLKAKNVALVDDGGTYGSELTQIISKYLVSRKIRVGTRLRVGNDYVRALEQLKKLKPDVVHVGFSSYETSARFITQMRQKGIQAQVMGTAVLADPLFLELAGSDAKGVYYTSYVGPVEAYPSPEIPKLINEYRDILESKPSSYSILGYDAMSVALSALRSAIKSKGGKLPSRAEVQDAIRKVDLPDALSGAITFNSHGDRQSSSVFIMRIDPSFKTKVVSILTVFPDRG